MKKKMKKKILSIQIYVFFFLVKSIPTYTHTPQINHLCLPHTRFKTLKHYVFRFAQVFNMAEHRCISYLLLFSNTHQGMRYNNKISRCWCPWWSTENFLNTIFIELKYLTYEKLEGKKNKPKYVVVPRVYISTCNIFRFDWLFFIYQKRQWKQYHFSILWCRKWTREKLRHRCMKMKFNVSPSLYFFVFISSVCENRRKFPSLFMFSSYMKFSLLPQHVNNYIPLGSFLIVGWSGVTKYVYVSCFWGTF